jgi:hypothetical protein
VSPKPQLSPNFAGQKRSSSNFLHKDISDKYQDCDDSVHWQLNMALPPFVLPVRKVLDFERNSKIAYEWIPTQLADNP